MGWIKPSEIIDALDGAVSFFRKYISRLSSLSECEMYSLILVLGSYLYAKYHIFSNNRKGDSYWVDATVINSVYNSTLSDIAVNIVMVRNKIAHVPFCEATNNAVHEVFCSEHLKELLVYENILDESGKFIEPEGGRYIPIETETKSSIASAISKMSGE